MSVAASIPTVTGYRGVTVAALIATFMQTADMTLPNAALPYIQGSLSMADDEAGRVFTAYIAAVSSPCR